MANLKKNCKGYGYKYTDLSEVHNYLESQGITYYQIIEKDGEDDYIYTIPIIDGKELPPRRGCRVVQATLQGVKNPAQEQGSALTYARRYSLLMAFGLATTDDDAQMLTQKTSKFVNKEKEDTSNELATKGDIARLQQVIKEKNLNEDEIFKAYKIKSGITKGYVESVLVMLNGGRKQ